jgi:hypothetical protein
MLGRNGVLQRDLGGNLPWQQVLDFVDRPLRDAAIIRGHAGCRNRTCDPIITNDVLYQLS